jgi:hypothetical protein
MLHSLSQLQDQPALAVSSNDRVASGVEIDTNPAGIPAGPGVTVNSNHPEKDPVPRQC